MTVTIGNSEPPTATRESRPIPLATAISVLAVASRHPIERSSGSIAVGKRTAGQRTASATPTATEPPSRVQAAAHRGSSAAALSTPTKKRPNPRPASAASASARGETETACGTSASRTASAIPQSAATSPAIWMPPGASPRIRPTATGTTTPIETSGEMMLTGPIAIAE